MKGLGTIYRRELAGLFLAPLAWFLLAISFLLCGWIFVAVIKESGGHITGTLRTVAGGEFHYWMLMLFLPPLLTMRMISEESRNGMLEFLLTSPVSDAAVVAGKFLAAWTLMGLFWLAIIVYALTIQAVGGEPDWPQVWGSYLGAVLVAGLFTSLGLFSSAVFHTPALAAFVALVASLLVLMLPQLTGLIEWSWLHQEVASVDILAQFHRSFLVGVLDTKVLVFFLAWTGFFLFLAIRSVEAKRWR